MASARALWKPLQPRAPSLLKVLVIGAEGQLAHALVETAKSTDIAVVAVGRPELDLLKPTPLARAVEDVAPNVVVNVAAYTGVDKAETEPELAYAINAEGAGRVAEACAGKATPLIHISTDYVFDGELARSYREDDQPAPLGVYAQSKLDGERHVADVCQRHVILRTAWVYSPFGNNFLKTMLRLADNQSEIGVVDDQIGNPTYAPHLAEGILAVARQIISGPENDRRWGVYHMAGAGEATWCRLAREIFAQSKSLGGPVAHVRPIRRAEYPMLAKRPANSRLDCSNCASVFGVRLPEWPIGVAECVRRLLRSNASLHIALGTQ